MKPRHIFWIMTDEQRLDTVTAGSGPMPVLTELAAGGTRFEQAITPSPMCVPARTSLLTGSLPGATGVWRNRKNPSVAPPAPDLLDWLREAGYATVSLGKQHYRLSRPAFDVEEDLVLSDLVDYTEYRNGRSHTNYGGVQFPGPTPWIMAGTFPGRTEETAEWRLVDRAIGMMRNLDRAQPILMRLSFNAPHTPVAPPAEYVDAAPERFDTPPSFLRTNPEWPGWLRLLQQSYADAGSLSGPELLTIRRHYYAQCAFLDAMIARFVSFLDDEGLLRESVVVFCSDHGTHLGEHGLVQKQSFFTESAVVPYCFAGADVARQSVRTPVSTRSLLPTAAALAGLACPTRWRSLDYSDATRGGSGLASEPVVSQGMLNPALLDCDNRLVMVQRDNLRAVFDLDAPEERALLFDLDRDPHELESLDSDPSYDGSLGLLRGIAHESVTPAYDQ